MNEGGGRGSEEASVREEGGGSEKAITRGGSGKASVCVWGCVRRQTRGVGRQA